MPATATTRAARYAAPLQTMIALTRSAVIRITRENAGPLFCLRRSSINLGIPSGSRPLLEEGDDPLLGGLGWTVLAHVYGEH